MKLLSFDFNNNSIRTILIDNEPWFVLKDIGKVLELSNHKQALIDMKTRLQKGGVKDEVSQTYPIKDSLNRTQEVTIVSEAGLYELAFVSRKEEAIRFRHWVARVVLPSIRKTGSYSLSELPNFSEILSQNEEAKKLVELFEETKPFHLLLLQKLLKENSISSLFGIDFQNTYFLPTELGKLHGLSGRETNLLLEKRGFQEKQDGIWKLTESGKEFGVEIGGTYHQLKWKLETLL
jgi:prophage antirepressor-like protein